MGAGHLEQVRGALALLPQRGPLVRIPPRQEQRAGGAFAEAGGEQGGGADEPAHLLLDLLGGEDEQVRAGRFLSVRDPQHDPVIGRHDLAVQPVPLFHPGADGQSPRPGDPLPVGAVQHHPPVAELVEEPFDDQLLRSGDRAGRLLLLGEMIQQHRAGVVVEPQAGQMLEGLCAGEGRELALRRGDRAAERRGTPVTVAVPERDPTAQAESGGDGDAGGRDLLDPPAGGAERDHVPAP